jgi:hypothetical protein
LPALWTVVLIVDNYKDNNTLIKYSIKDYGEFATRYKAKYSMLRERRRVGTSYQLEYIDRDGNSYLGTYIHHTMAII